MTMVRILLFAALLFPLAEIAVFVAVAAIIGFGWALGLLALMSIAGALILRHAGGAHIARIRTAFGENRLSALRADGTGVATLIAGLLLAVPGFISGFFGVLLLGWSVASRSGGAPHASQSGDGVVDLDPQDWRTLPDENDPGRRLPDDRNHDRRS